MPLVTVRDCCIRDPHVLVPDGRTDIDNIALVIKAAEAEADEFFARNHVTVGMRLQFETGSPDLDAAAGRLPARSTHLMVSFALIARSPAVRQRSSIRLASRSPAASERPASRLLRPD
jgi:hypothetical protein